MQQAYAPGNVSCIFSTYRGDSYQTTGSLGVGFTINAGVYVKASSGDSGIKVNGVEQEFATVNDILELLKAEKVSLEIETELPFGCGFGMSGASALASAYAVNAELDLGLEQRDLALYAHIAEVKNGTGLGDVAGQFTGGLMCRTQIGDPLDVQVLSEEKREVFCKVFGPIETSSVINSEEKRKIINKAGELTLQEFRADKELAFKEIVDISREFAFSAGLLSSKKVSSEINEIVSAGGSASMIMLGEAVYSDREFFGSKKYLISSEGARLL